MLTFREQAQMRIDNDSRLGKYEATIMYDWAEDDQHWLWVMTAPVAEIVDWAEAVEASD